MHLSKSSYERRRLIYKVVAYHQSDDELLPLGHDRVLFYTSASSAACPMFSDEELLILGVGFELWF
jgi:hypothetical protein